MYAVPASFEQLVKDLTSDEIPEANARLLVYVELTLFLVEHLGLDAEPLTVGWVLLSRVPLHHSRLNRLSREQRRMWANTAIIVPLSSRYAWEVALTRYGKDIPLRYRLYDVSPVTRLDEQMINVCRQQPSPEPGREKRYQEILNETLSFEKRSREFTQPDKTYRVRVKLSKGDVRIGRVKITRNIQRHVDQNLVWFDSFSHPRRVLTLSMADLLPTAEFLDEHERRIGELVHWVADLKHIRFRRATIIDGQVCLDDENVYPLHLEGSVHLPGVVSAGKTTLAKLIIAYCIRHDINIRITLVVGDTNTSIEIAHQVNSWFFDDPAGDDVVAVPLLGVSQRETHLERLLISRHYKHCLEKRRPHWGERWLMPVCPLASQIHWEGDSNVTIPAGQEPCQGLLEESPPKKRRSKRHVCPLFSICPSKQIYRDMSHAKLWVTTPGALSQATMPLHLDTRIITIGDLVYEQCDLVILDEVETIVDWYDKTFAKKEELTNGKDGLLDKLDPQIAQYWNANRVISGSSRHWMVTARESPKALSSILTTLADKKQERVAKHWVRRGYFAPHQLAYLLARRLAGLKEWDDKDTSIDVRRDNEARTQKAFTPFSELLNGIRDPLRHPVDTDNAADGLAQIMQNMNNRADDVTDEDLFIQCRVWILRWYPDFETLRSELEEKLRQSSDKFDLEYVEKHLDRSVDEVAGRLQFMLTVTLLDRHLHIVLEEWHHKPEELDAAQPFSKIPRGAKRILPLPLTGRMYGFVSETKSIKYNRDAANRLSLFSYTNIGRSYLLNFHRLREDFEDKSGPHVLSLSGTSYLPDSTAFHVPIPPAGILMPPRQTEQAIKDSRFIWRYFKDEKERPINVSGEPNKEAQLRRLMTAMLEDGGIPGGFIGGVLKWLETESEKPEWADRARILMLTNSYSQSKGAAQVLRDSWRDAADTIYDLKRGKDEDYQIETSRGNELQRIDIEQFAQTDGRILIAPMQAIGRGFNILNNLPERKAAFGAVFFLTRPMNIPNDREAIAQELNRYALAWADDPAFSAWQTDTLYSRAMLAREKAVELRRKIEHRRGYRGLTDDAELRLYPRRDLAATTAGRIVQAVGRLLRGGVPFRAFFIDAAWSPDLAKTGDTHRKEPEETSLLTALINILSEYAYGNAIGEHLYGGLRDALITTENRDNN